MAHSTETAAISHALASMARLKVDQTMIAELVHEIGAPPAKNAPVSTKVKKVKSDVKTDVSWTDNKGSSPTIDMKDFTPTRKK